VNKNLITQSYEKKLTFFINFPTKRMKTGNALAKRDIPMPDQQILPIPAIVIRQDSNGE
jgi:hypothetical protein